MDELKDLNLIISEAKRMSNTFRAFERIPRVLEIIQSSSSYVDGLEKTAKKKQSDIANIDKAIADANGKLSAMNDKVKDKIKEYEDLDAVIAEEKSVLMDIMAEDLKEIKDINNQEISESNELMESKIAENEAAVQKSKDNMLSVLETHKSTIEKYDRLAKESKERADEAVENLEKIKKSLMGGV